MGVRAQQGLVGSAYAIRTLLFEWLLHARLVPDTTSYAHGGSAWSSPATAAAGLVAGRIGVDVFSIAASFALGAIVVDAAGSRRALALFVSPFGWYVALPSADAAGAAGAALAWRARARWVGPLALLHLEAALVVCCVHAARRLGVRRLGAVALLAGLGACAGQWHWQARYFLPGAAIFAAGAPLRRRRERAPARRLVTSEL